MEDPTPVANQTAEDDAKKVQALLTPAEIDKLDSIARAESRSRQGQVSFFVRKGLESYPDGRG